MGDTRHSAELESRLRQAEQEKAGQYDKRTEHLSPDGRAEYVNRLVLEDSPYLLQHAHNPVYWFPWGDEALAVARAEDKPVFLSIGYSTCHWCHVMEVESFDDVEVAELLNEHFISIKMDREQYPDVDEIYMTGVQLVSGHGGWPMSSFLLPDGRPFFGATYFPKSGFMDLLRKIASVWKDQREELAESAASIDAAIKRVLVEKQPEATLAPDLVPSMVNALLEREDKELGGLAGTPKFPQEPILLFLLDQTERDKSSGAGDGNTQALTVVAAESSAWQVVAVELPAASHQVSLGDAGSVPAYGDCVRLQVQLEPAGESGRGNGPAILQTNLQLCEQGRCLLPETVPLLSVSG